MEWDDSLVVAVLSNVVMMAQQQCAKTWGRACSRVWRVGTALFFAVYVIALLIAGTTSRGDPDSLKNRWKCCSGVHVACGLFGWYFPPLFIVFTLYQLLDKYGLLTHGPQTWQSSLVDYSEFFVGVGLVYFARAMRPVRSACCLRCFRSWRSTGKFPREACPIDVDRFFARDYDKLKNDQASDEEEVNVELSIPP